MRTMYDALVASNIPAGATMVAGYADVIHLADWSDADWARFPNAIKVRIVKKASTVTDGHVLDVENGDATPDQAPGWVTARRSRGQDPTVYCNASTWAAVQQAFRSAGVAQPHYWIAQYPGGGAVLPTLNGITAVAHQYTNGAKFDTSVVANVWSGVDSTGGTAMTSFEDEPSYTVDSTPADTPKGRLQNTEENARAVRTELEALIPVINSAVSSTVTALLAAPLVSSGANDSGPGTVGHVILHGDQESTSVANVLPALTAFLANPTGATVDPTALATAVAADVAPLITAASTTPAAFIAALSAKLGA